MQKTHTKTAARKLKRARLSRGLKAKWVADQIGLSAVALSRRENGVIPFGPEEAAAYCKAIGTDVSFVLS